MGEPEASLLLPYTRHPVCSPRNHIGNAAPPSIPTWELQGSLLSSPGCNGVGLTLSLEFYCCQAIMKPAWLHYQSLEDTAGSGTSTEGG